MLSDNIHLLGGGLATAVGCAVILATRRWHGRYTTDAAEGVQKVHAHPTPRVGGLAMFVGLWVTLWLVPKDIAAILQPLGWASIPAFVFGMAEDITKRVGPTERLVATIVSAVLAWALTGISLTSVGVWAVDDLLAFVPFSVAFTAIAIAGIANAVNIVDGLNGLASGIVLISTSALGGIAYLAGDTLMAKACFSMGGVIAGFMLFNFPWGKIFMGDGGAYMLGFMLGWMAVLVSVRNPSVSPWAGLLACGHLVFEVLFSMLRRLKRNLHPGHPDRLHLHSLVKSRFIRKRLPNLPPAIKNSAATPFVWLVAAVPASLGVAFCGSTPVLIASFVVSAMVYQWVYRRLVAFSLR